MWLRSKGSTTKSCFGHKVFLFSVDVSSCDASGERRRLEVLRSPSNAICAAPASWSITAIRSRCLLRIVQGFCLSVIGRFYHGRFLSAKPLPSATISSWLQRWILSHPGLRHGWDTPDRVGSFGEMRDYGRLCPRACRAWRMPWAAVLLGSRWSALLTSEAEAARLLALKSMWARTSQAAAVGWILREA
jgi:hypothetical protein